MTHCRSIPRPPRPRCLALRRTARVILAAVPLLAPACAGPTDPEPSTVLVYDAEPSWSLDGRNIAFVRTGGPRGVGLSAAVSPAAAGWRADRVPYGMPPVGTSFVPSPMALMVVAAEGGTPRAVAAEVVGPAWLPGAQGLLGVTTSRRTLVRVRLDGAGAVEPVSDSSAFYFDPAVSPEGAVAVVSDRTDAGARGGQLRVHLLGADGRLRPLNPAAGTGQGVAPSWGPGSRLAYQAWSPGAGTQIVTTDTTPGAVPVPVAAGFAPSWSPTGEWIAYMRDPNGTAPQLRLVRPDGTGDRLLLQGAGTAGAVRGRGAWSPDGRRLAVARATGTEGLAIWTVDVATGALRRVTTPAARAAGP